MRIMEKIIIRARAHGSRVAMALLVKRNINLLGRDIVVCRVVPFMLYLASLIMVPGAALANLRS